MLKKIFSFMLIFSVSVAFAQDITSGLGIAMFKDDTYMINVIITPDSTGAVKEWFTTSGAPQINTTSNVKLNQEAGLFLTVSPSRTIENANITYTVMLKLPNGEITPPTNHVLAQGALEKGVLYPIQGQMSTIVADDPADCGIYEFIVDLFDDGEKLQRVVMVFNIVE